MPKTLIYPVKYHDSVKHGSCKGNNDRAKYNNFSEMKMHQLNAEREMIILKGQQFRSLRTVKQTKTKKSLNFELFEKKV